MTAKDAAVPDDVDVVVVGAGGAGTVAALAAREAGAQRVLVLEELGKAGGNAIWATGLFACESHIQRAQMVDVSADEVFQQAMEFNHNALVNPRVLRAYITKSGDTIRWLVDHGIAMMIGVEYKMSYDQPATWHLPTKDPDRANGEPSKYSLVIRSLVEQAAAAGVTMLTSTRCDSLIVQDGRVVGVRVEREGSMHDITAREVVLSTGGFHGNPELMRHYFPFWDESIGGWRTPMSGAGIELARSAGAAVEGWATLIKETCSSSDSPNEFCLGPATREPYTMWVNKLGRRFVDESVAVHLQTGSNPLMLQPDKTAWAIYDQAMVDDVMRDGWLLPRAPVRDVRLQQHLDSAVAKGEWAARADTVGGLAAFIGADEQALTDTVDEYNEHCARGYDATFVKDRRYLHPLSQGPFYAIRFRPMIIDTAGPVRVDERMQVLDDGHRPIPGLLAAGSVASGWLAHDYCGQYLFGSALGFAVNSARIAAETAAARIGALQQAAR